MEERDDDGRLPTSNIFAWKEVLLRGDEDEIRSLLPLHFVDSDWHEFILHICAVEGGRSEKLYNILADVYGSKLLTYTSGLVIRFYDILVDKQIVETTGNELLVNEELSARKTAVMLVSIWKTILRQRPARPGYTSPWDYNKDNGNIFLITVCLRPRPYIIRATESSAVFDWLIHNEEILKIPLNFNSVEQVFHGIFETLTLPQRMGVQRIVNEAQQSFIIQRQILRRDEFNAAMVLPSLACQACGGRLTGTPVMSIIKAFVGLGNKTEEGVLNSRKSYAEKARKELEKAREGSGKLSQRQDAEEDW
jgi:hypothetical protein